MKKINFTEGANPESVENLEEIKVGDKTYYVNIKEVKSVDSDNKIIFFKDGSKITDKETMLYIIVNNKASYLEHKTLSGLNEQ